MLIDPVVELAEQLRAVEDSLRTVGKEQDYERTNKLVVAVLLLRKVLRTTEPTSALGASELLFIVGKRLRSAEFPYLAHLRLIAERFGNGQRLLADLIWLRAVAESLDGGCCGAYGRELAGLLHSAIKGASKPVLIFRAMSGNWREDADQGPLIAGTARPVPPAPPHVPVETLSCRAEDLCV